MPELPDVQVFKEYLDSTALHREIESVDVGSTDVLEDVSKRELAGSLPGRSIESSRRHGKWLFGELSGDEPGWLLLHFGMTGSLEAWKGEDDPPEHARVRLDFEDGWHLAFVCPRKLGRVGLVDDVEVFVEERELGPDALEVERETFVEALSGKRGTLKGALMNQSLLAGIGNEYSDEILFQAGLHPRTAVSELDEERLGELFDTMREVLETAIEARVDTSRMPDDWHLPHRHGDGTCPKCGKNLQRLAVVGLSVYWSPDAQSRP
ncbi:MAG: DNA-formamidopyrimidine glycosylase family protein [Gemmatimonadota bacterium]|nr:DNA-formamidopyrimidine glycosylase family protein [Gemmatimonadota bacterium]